jgi:hypothetical protein
MPLENNELPPASPAPRIAPVTLAGIEPRGYTNPGIAVVTTFLPADRMRHRSPIASFIRDGAGAA